MHEEALNLQEEETVGGTLREEFLESRAASVAATEGSTAERRRLHEDNERSRGHGRVRPTQAWPDPPDRGLDDQEQIEREIIEEQQGTEGPAFIPIWPISVVDSEGRPIESATVELYQRWDIPVFADQGVPLDQLPDRPIHEGRLMSRQNTDEYGVARLRCQNIDQGTEMAVSVTKRGYSPRETRNAYLLGVELTLTLDPLTPEPPDNIVWQDGLELSDFFVKFFTAIGDASWSLVQFLAQPFRFEWPTSRKVRRLRERLNLLSLEAARAEDEFERERADLNMQIQAKPVPMNDAIAGGYLLEFGEHKEDCAVFREDEIPEDEPIECNCGFADALDSVGKKKGPLRRDDYFDGTYDELRRIVNEANVQTETDAEIVEEARRRLNAGEYQETIAEVGIFGTGPRFETLPDSAEVEGAIEEWGGGHEFVHTTDEGYLATYAQNLPREMQTDRHRLVLPAAPNTWSAWMQLYDRVPGTAIRLDIAWEQHEYTLRRTDALVWDVPPTTIVEFDIGIGPSGSERVTISRCVVPRNQPDGNFNGMHSFPSIAEFREQRMTVRARYVNPNGTRSALLFDIVPHIFLG